MLKYIFIVLFSILGTGAMAQDQDSMMVIRKDANWAIKYVVKPGEYVRMLALRFCVSEALILSANEPEAIKKSGPGSVIYIPVIGDNFFSVRQPLGNLRELYYEVKPKDEIGVISTYSGVTKNQMRSWNSLKGNTLIPGQKLLVGWVKMIPRDTANLATIKAYPSTRKKVVADTNKAIVPGGLDTVYARQTNNGLSVLTEKGTAVFFEKAGKSNTYQAFHNTARRGTVIKVFNPGNGKTIYVKVLGTIPDTKQYANSIIGISDSAKEALGVTDSKAWCELTYSTN